MGTNFVKDKLAQGGVALGIWSIINSPVVTELLGGAGFDFQILDLEHGLFDMGSLDNSVRACELTGCSPLVRVSRLDPPQIQRVLDLGIHGVVVPQVTSRSAAEEAVAAMHYAPRGTRGFNPFTRAAEYSNARSNLRGKLHPDFLLSSVIIESVSAYQDLPEILRIPDLDMVYLGIYDMSVALGCAGDTHAPAVTAFVEDSVAQIASSGKSAGMMVRSEKEIDDAIRLGATFLVWAVDTFLIQQAARGAVKSLAAVLERGAEAAAQ